MAFSAVDGILVLCTASSSSSGTLMCRKRVVEAAGVEGGVLTLKEAELLPFVELRGLDAGRSLRIVTLRGHEIQGGA
jgi:hypothetical protein